MTRSLSQKQALTQLHDFMRRRGLQLPPMQDELLGKLKAKDLQDLAQVLVMNGRVAFAFRLNELCIPITMHDLEQP